MIFALLSLALAAEPAGEATPMPVADLSEADTQRGLDASAAERAHLTRLGVFAGASALTGGTMMAVAWDDPRARHFAIQSVPWAGVDAIIVGAAWKGAGRVKSPAEIATTREVLQLNVGLDAGYMMAGATMGVLGRHRGMPGVEGAGWGIVAQGLGLLVLDVIVLRQMPRAVD